MKKNLFVCLGNICRSPMGEGALLHLVEQKGLTHQFQIDSAGTSANHTGERADERMRKTAKHHGIELKSRARQVLPEDFERFDLILAMDRSNYTNLLELAARHGHNTDHVRLLRDFDPQDRGADVPDPYYGGQEGFEEVYQMVMRSCNTLLDNLESGEDN